MRLLGSILALAAFASLAAGDAPKRPRDTRPNVLLILSDDLNTALGCYGHPIVRTPAIDRLARRGVRFERAYCQYPLCNPSRTSFLTGRRPDTTRIFGNGQPPRAHLGDAPWLPEYFRRHGYFTAGIGKIAHGRFADTLTWDVYEEPNRGGGQGAGRLRRGMPPRGAGRDDEGGLFLVWQPSDRPDEEEPDGRVARRVAELMAQQRDRPFFLAAGFHRPHQPFVAPRRYFGQYPPERIPLPAYSPDDRSDIPAPALTRRPVDENRSDAEKREVIAAYYACVSFLDAQVGVLLDALDRLNLWDRTVVVFASDHGFHLGEHNLWAKVTLFEEAARVPLIVAAPGRRRGAVCQRLTELVDLFPTLAELCRLPAPEGLEGRSLLPLLRDPRAPGRPGALTQLRRGRIEGRSVRTERFRYTEWDEGRAGVELYDHATDPREIRNLARDPAFAETIASLKPLLRPASAGRQP